MNMKIQGRRSRGMPDTWLWQTVQNWTNNRSSRFFLINVFIPDFIFETETIQSP